MRLVQLPTFSTFAVICSHVNLSAFNAVVYRTSSVMQAFFDDFSDLLDRLVKYSTPSVIGGD